MKYERIIRFQYYVVKYSKYVNDEWEEPKKFNLVKWLEMVEHGGYIKKSVEFNGVRARVDKLTYDDKNELWCIRFMKLRDTNIPSKVKENEEAEVIPLQDDEYIGEDLNMIYERKSGIAMIQSNRFSLSTSKISDFIQSVMKREDCRVIFAPICDAFSAKHLKKHSVRSIDVSFSNVIDLNSSMPEDCSLSSIIRSMKKWGGVVGHINVSLGRTKEDSLVKSEIDQIIREIEENKPYISSAKIKLRDDDEARTEVVDLFDNVAHDYIIFTLKKRATLGYEYAINNMIETFLRSRIKLYKLIGLIKE